MTDEKKDEEPAGVPAPFPFSPAPVQRHGHLRLIMWILVPLLLAGSIALWFVIHREGLKEAAAKANKGPPPISVTSVTAQKGDIGVYLDAIGTVTPIYTASITSQVTGMITTVHYQEGQTMEKGAPLIDIDDRPFRATLLQAQGALERDQQMLAQAQMDLKRYRAAWARNAIAQQILEDQEKLVLQDQGVITLDQGSILYDQAQVDFCHIAAPFAGRVGLRLVDPGNVVQSSGSVTLAIITQLKPVTVIFTVPEDNLDKVLRRLRAGATLATDAYDRTAQKKLATGVFLSLDNQIDTTTGTVKGRSLFDNAKDELFPNQFVNTRLLVETLTAVTLVPSSAVQQNGQDTFVYVLDKDVVHRRAVKTGVVEGGTTQVEGIDAGMVLANSSFDKLQDNAAVTLAPAEPPAKQNESPKP